MTLTQADIEDLLDDLGHDLGKYIVLPLNFLPADAADDEVREAVRKGLLEIRRLGSTYQSARDIYQDFVSAVGHRLDHLTCWKELEAVMAITLKWTKRIENRQKKLSRPEAESELRAVGTAIRRLEAEFKDE